VSLVYVHEYHYGGAFPYLSPPTGLLVGGDDFLAKLGNFGEEGNLGVLLHLTTFIVIPKFTLSISIKFELCNNFIGIALDIVSIKINILITFLVPSCVHISTCTTHFFRIACIIISYLVTCGSYESKLGDWIFTAVYIVSI
jgi:hypothetical protein